MISKWITSFGFGFALVFLLASCAQSPGSTTPVDKYSELPFKIYPLLWESQDKEGEHWSNYLIKIIHEEAPDLVQNTEDMGTFCPRYESLDTNERVNFWALLVSAMSKFESNYNPVSRMLETTMGIDPVTGKRVYSEGLLQLSYQDVRSYPFCEFDWNKDKNLSPKDPAKTILDPYKNLSCGVKILAHQVQKRNRITLSNGVYWSVLKIGGRYSKVSQIAALTRQMPGCMK